MNKERIALSIVILFCHLTSHFSYALISSSSLSQLQSSITVKSSRELQQQHEQYHNSNELGLGLRHHPRIGFSWKTALQPLCARRTSAGAGAGGKKAAGAAGKKKKPKSGGGVATNKKGNPKKTRKTTTAERKATQLASSNAPATSSTKKTMKQPHRAPPWQVLSKKDMDRNLRAEKQRRKLAKEEGIHNVDILQQEAFADGLDSAQLKLSQSFLSVPDKALLAWKRFKAQPRQDQVEFIGAYLNKQIPPTLGAPEVAFLGRSNVGKSSLLNRLTQSDEARVGKTPGATASVNLYGMYRGASNVNGATALENASKCLLGLVDLPGFGYAKLSKETKEAVQLAAERYLDQRKELMLGILLVDIRRIPSTDDKAVLAALYDSEVPIIVVATKLDKLSSAPKSANAPPSFEVTSALKAIQEGLGLPEGQPLCVSSTTGEGIKDLWRIIMEACEGGVEELRTKLLEQGGSDGNDRFAGEEDHDAPFQDGEDVAYSQGYDWIHDSASVMYEDEDGETGGYTENEGSDDGGDADVEDGNFDEYDNLDQDIRQRDGGSLPLKSLRELRQQATEMEKRGEL